MKHSPRFLELVYKAKSRVEETTTQEVFTRLNASESLILLDVREESEWQLAHIPGAVHLGRGILERDIEKAIPNLDSELILYCGGGFRSALAAESLGKMGYTRVLSMDGGFSEWVESGLPVERGVPQP